MIFLSILIYLPKFILFIISISILFLHNVLDGAIIPQNKILDFLLAFFHQSRSVTIYDDFSVFILYPVLPIIALMTLGYILGEWFKEDFEPGKRIKYLLFTGTAMILLFISIRFINQYGDPKHCNHSLLFLYKV